MAPKAALYLRVSTEKQNAANQLAEVEALARARGFEPVIYGETISAAAKKRPEFERMFADARSGKIKAVAIWALDRFGRSMVGNVRDVLELERLGVRVLSVREQWLDTDADNPTRKLLISIFSWIAEQEREQLRARTRAGLRRAVEAGKTLGRPRVKSVPLTLAIEGVTTKRITVRVACDTFNVSERTLRRAMKAKAA